MDVWKEVEGSYEGSVEGGTGTWVFEVRAEITGGDCIRSRNGCGLLDMTNGSLCISHISWEPWNPEGIDT